MKAYKAFNKDLTCLGFQYEVGKTYEMEEEPLRVSEDFMLALNSDDLFHLHYKYGKENSNL